jgi:hypothetical protein
MPKKKLQQAFA